MVVGTVVPSRSVSVTVSIPIFAVVDAVLVVVVGANIVVGVAMVLVRII